MKSRDFAGGESVPGSGHDPIGRFPARLGFALLAVLAAAASPPERLDLPGPPDTIAKAGLPDARLTGIIAQVAATSFDRPADWRKELRFRQGRIEGEPVLVVRGADLLCGATGGCETWLFHRKGRRWVDAIVGEAPVADTIALAPHRTSGRLDLVAGNRISAMHSAYAVYAFDGRKYRRKSCFEAAADGAGLPSGKRQPTACR
jgi:hypothetical protein